MCRSNDRETILSGLGNIHVERQGNPVPDVDDVKSQLHYAAKITVNKINLKFTISLFNLYCGTIYVIPGLYDQNQSMYAQNKAKQAIPYLQIKNTSREVFLKKTPVMPKLTVINSPDHKV